MLDDTASLYNIKQSKCKLSEERVGCLMARFFCRRVKI